jgi:hypothetical protein
MGPSFSDFRHESRCRELLRASWWRIAFALYTRVGSAVPDTDELNPRGLMAAAIQGLKAHSRIGFELERLMLQVSSDENLAIEINEAVRDTDEERLIALLRRGGISDDVEVTVVNLDPDFHCNLRFCLFGFCASCEMSW